MRMHQHENKKLVITEEANEENEDMKPIPYSDVYIWILQFGSNLSLINNSRNDQVNRPFSQPL